MVKIFFIIGFIVALASQRSFVGTAPVSESDRENTEIKEDVSVQELENLKHSIGRTLSMMKTQTGFYSDLNGKKQTHSTSTEEVKQNGQVVSKLSQQRDTDSDALDKGGQPKIKVRTEMDIPSEGIHKSIIQKFPNDYTEQTENSNRKASNLESSQDMEKSNSVSRITQQYTPLDMAEYVFWTGDEKSVSLAIEEFLQERMMTREEAIIFLQEIKYNLDYLKSHYSRFGLNSREQVSTSTKEKQEPQENYQITRKPEVQHEKSVNEQIRSELNQLRQLQEVYKKRNVDRDTGAIYFTESNQEKPTGTDGKVVPNEEYAELLERLRLADFLYTEYSLEEIIYQLAKIMFTQSLKGGNAEAQQALTRFMNFLEKEAEQGHISRALEKKVLDVLIASLSDTVSEHPELLNMRGVTQQYNENIAGQQFLKQILALPSEDKAFLQKILNTNFDVNQEKIERSNQLKHNYQNKDSSKIDSHNIPFGLGK